MLTHAASYTTFGSDHKPLSIEIHLERIRGTLRHAGMAPLPCGAQAMVDDGETHLDVLSPRDRQ